MCHTKQCKGGGPPVLPPSEYPLSLLHVPLTGFVTENSPSAVSHQPWPLLSNPLPQWQRPDRCPESARRTMGEWGGLGQGALVTEPLQEGGLRPGDDSEVAPPDGDVLRHRFPDDMPLKMISASRGFVLSHMFGGCPTPSPPDPPSRAPLWTPGTRAPPVDGGGSGSKDPPPPAPHRRAVAASGDNPAPACPPPNCLFRRSVTEKNAPRSDPLPLSSLLGLKAAGVRV